MKNYVSPPVGQSNYLPNSGLVYLDEMDVETFAESFVF